jgi:hypothetical protein
MVRVEEFEDGKMILFRFFRFFSVKVINTISSDLRIKLFGANFLDELKSDLDREDAVTSIVDALEGVGRRQHDSGFAINYIRLRFVAQKPDPSRVS